VGWILRREVLVLAAAIIVVACDDAPVRIVAPAPSAADPPMARIIAVSGDVRVLRAGSAGWATAAAGDPLLPGDSVQTLGEARASVRFERDHAATQLAPGTTIRMPELEGAVTRLTHLSGRLTARIGDGAAGQRLEVDLPPGTLVLSAASGVAGELVEAQIDVDEERTSIAMIRGAGRLRRARGEVLELPAERFVAVAPDGEIVARGWSLRGATVLEPAADAIVRTRSEVTFRWAEVASASGYVLRVVGADGAAREVDSAVTVARISLGAGTYSWSVLATIDGERTQPSDERTVIVSVDQRAPTLEVRSPAPGRGVRDPQLLVEGTTEPGASLDLDGDPIAVAADGSFHTTRSVRRGLTQLIFRVHDDVGNVRVVARTVVRE